MRKLRLYDLLKHIQLVSDRAGLLILCAFYCIFETYLTWSNLYILSEQFENFIKCMYSCNQFQNHIDDLVLVIEIISIAPEHSLVLGNSLKTFLVCISK